MLATKSRSNSTSKSVTEAARGARSRAICHLAKNLLQVYFNEFAGINRIERNAPAQNSALANRPGASKPRVSKSQDEGLA